MIYGWFYLFIYILRFESEISNLFEFSEDFIIIFKLLNLSYCSILRIGELELMSKELILKKVLI